MARSAAAQIVNNFVGGLVTEANGLTFPPNSLSKAMNVEIGVDGSIYTRTPFSRNTSNMDWQETIPSSTFLFNKIFHWDAIGFTVVATCYIDEFIITILDTTGQATSTAAAYSLNATRTAENLKDFDIAFSNDSAYYAIPTILEDTGRVVSYISCIKYDKASNSFTVTLPYSEDTSQSTVRTPATGDFWDGRTGTVLDGRGVSEYRDNRVWNWPTDGIANRVVPKSQSSLIHNGVTYKLGYFKESTSIVGGDVYFYGIFKVEGAGENSFIISGAQPLYYRDLQGVPNTVGTNRTKVVENHRQDQGSGNILYNLYNAGWEQSNGDHKYSTDKKGSAVATAVSSLCASSRNVAGKYPSLCDASYDWKTETATVPEALDLFNPMLMKESPPYRNTSLRGNNILALGREMRGSLEGFKQPGTIFFPLLLKDPSDESDNASLVFFSDIDDKCKDSKVSAISHINGRLWYGVESNVANIFFSQVKGSGQTEYYTKSLEELTCCYQRNNPTDETQNEVLPSDGGHLTIGGCGKILKILPLGSHIVVFGERGIWAISGELNGSFTPTAYNITKVSSSGLVSSSAVCQVEENIVFLSDNSIKMLSPDLQVQDISSGKILKKAKEFCDVFSKCESGHGIVYDSSNKRILMHIPAAGVTGTAHILGLGLHVLVFDLRLGAFYEWETSSSIPVYSQLVGWIGATQNGDYYVYDNSQGRSFDVVSLGFVKRLDGSAELLQQRYKAVNPDEYEVVFDIERFYHIFKQELSTTRSEYSGSVPNNYETSFEIPFNNFENVMTNKIITEIGVLLDSSKDYTFVQPGNVVVFPQTEMGWSWDWAREESGSTVISTNLRYPVVPSVGQRDVEVVKYRIPGSGRVLTLDFRDSALENSHGFKLLGYYFDFSMGR